MERIITTEEQQVFKTVAGHLESQIDVITDGYDPTPRPLDIPVSQDPKLVHIPLGHVALKGDL